MTSSIVSRPLDRGRLLHEGDMLAQLALSMANVESRLAVADLDLRDVVRITVRATDVEAVRRSVAAVTERLDAFHVSPRVDLVGVSGLDVPGMAVEVEVHLSNPLPEQGETVSPISIAPDTFVISQHVGGGPEPVVHLNSMVIRGAEPVIVDTGMPMHRDAVLADVFSLVEPEDVRWIYVSHDDIDHYGNANALMQRCPNATLVAEWFLCQRLVGELDCPPVRWRWVADGEHLDVGDRMLVALRPPLYDSPTTRGLLDPTTGVYWASDCFSTPVPTPTAFAEELPAPEFAGGFTTFHLWNSPWVSMVDETAFARQVGALQGAGITTVAGCHGPAVRGERLTQAFDLLRGLPTAVAPPKPAQPLLDEIITLMAAGMTAA